MNKKLIIIGIIALISGIAMFTVPIIPSGINQPKMTIFQWLTNLTKGVYS